MSQRRIINRQPGRASAVWLAALPFLLVVAAYLIGSDIRLDANPNDKLLPPLSKIWAAIDRLAFNEDKRTGNYLFWVDTLASLARLALGMAIATFGGLVIGIWFFTLVGWPLLPFMVLGAIFVVGYTDVLTKVGIGEVAAGLGLGAGSSARSCFGLRFHGSIRSSH